MHLTRNVKRAGAAGYISVGKGKAAAIILFLICSFAVAWATRSGNGKTAIPVKPVQPPTAHTKQPATRMGTWLACDASLAADILSLVALVLGMPARPGMGMLNDGNRHDHFDHHHDHFDHHREVEDVIFIGSFGFPWWWGWGYPYGYYGGYNYCYYGSGYAYGGSSRSRVADLQRRLARAGYYHGSIDGVLGSQTRRAIRAYERNHS